MEDPREQQSDAKVFSTTLNQGCSTHKKYIANKNNYY